MFLYIASLFGAGQDQRTHRQLDRAGVSDWRRVWVFLKSQLSPLDVYYIYIYTHAYVNGYIHINNSGLHLKTCAPIWRQSWVVAFMDTVHRKQRCYCHGSPLRQLVWIAGTCLVEFPTKSRGCGVWVVGVTKYAFFGFLPYRAMRQ